MEIIFAAGGAGILLGALLAWALKPPVNHKIESQLAEKHALLEHTQTQYVALEEKYTQESARREEAERRSAVAEQQLKDMQTRMQDWDNARKESVEMAKAAVMEAGGKLSNKLLEDHKRETSAQRKEQEVQARKTTEGLTKEFTRISEAVAHLNEDIKQQKTTVATVWKALSTPSEAGYFAEIGLENTLKNFGLLPGRDFTMQYATEGGKLRPDAVVFLPQDTVLVIDSKASKALLEIADAQSEEAQANAYASLKKTMAQHLRSLAGKDYRAAVQESLKQAGKETRMRRMLNVMYLPNEGALEHVQKADPEFAQKATNHEIILAGPTGLAGLIGLSRIEIDLAKQAENQEAILEASQKLLDSVITVLGHATAVGRGLKSAADHFQKFSASVNQRLLPRSKAMSQLGVRPSRNKEFPHHLPSFNVLEHSPVIEAENDEDTSQHAASKALEIADSY